MLANVPPMTTGDEQLAARSERISGAETLRRVVARFGALLDELAPEEWSRPTACYGDVQHLVGHLIGVEEAFLAVLAGAPDPAIGSTHEAMTEPVLRREDGRSPSATRVDWSDVTSKVMTVLVDRAPGPVPFYGTIWPLDHVLVIRAFELWIHEEDVRRSAGRPLAPPDRATLARIVEMAVSLLPVALHQAGRARSGQVSRLVLIGPSGGTWDVSVDGTHRTVGSAGPSGGEANARIVVDAAWFCRIVGGREDGDSAGAVLEGDQAVATNLLLSAATLALD